MPGVRQVRAFPQVIFYFFEKSRSSGLRWVFAYIRMYASGETLGSCVRCTPGWVLLDGTDVCSHFGHRLFSVG